jgi:hypothetical protein
LRIDNGRPRKSLAVERQDIEGIELHFVVMPARVQRIEVGDAVDTEHHCLAVDHELLMPVLQRRLDDPRVTVGPVGDRRWRLVICAPSRCVVAG